MSDSHAPGAVERAPICSRRELAIGVVFVALLTLAFFQPLLRGRTLSNIPSAQQLTAPWQAGAKPLETYPQTDQALIVYPFTVLETQALRSGTIPLWNPYIFGGTPFLANGLTGALYPARVLLALTVSPVTNHELFLVAHIFAAGIFMFLLLKQFRLRLSAALLGATAWMFASFTTGFMQDEVTLPVTTLLPAAVLLIHLSASRRSWRIAAAAGIPLGLMALGGQLELAAFAYAICGVYSLALWLAGVQDGPREWRALLRRLLPPVLTVATGACLAAVTLLPTVANASEGGREATPYADFVRTHTISVSQFKHVFEGGPRTGVTLLASGVFVGVAPIVLAFFGLLRRRPGAALGRWLAIGMFLLAIGTPVVSLLAYYLIPSISRTSTTGKLLWAFDFGVIVLAAIGLDWVLEWPRDVAGWLARRKVQVTRYAPAAAALVAVVALGATAWQLGRYARFINPPFEERRADLLFPATPAISAIRADSARRTSAEPQRLIGFQALIDDTASVFSFETADGYDGVVASRVRAYWRVVGGESVHLALREQKLVAALGLEKSGASLSYSTAFTGTTARYDMLAQSGVTTIVASPGEATVLKNNPGLTQPLSLRTVYDGPDASVFDIVGDQPPGWVVHDADVVRSGRAALKRFADPAFDRQHRMVIESDQGVGRPDATTHRGSGAGGSVTQDPIQFNGTAFTVHTKAPGWLVMPDMYAPGWSVSVNGRDANLLRADYTLRAVEVPAGRSRVVLTYRAPGFVPGLLVSGATTVALAVVAFPAVLALWRRRRGGVATATSAEGYDSSAAPDASRADRKGR